MLRLYFNRCGPLPWSVDEGPGTAQRLFVEVRIGVAQGRTVYEALTPEQDPNEVPCAWVEYSDCKLQAFGSTEAPSATIVRARW